VGGGGGGGGDGLPLVGEWVPAGDDGRKWRWSSSAVTVGRGEDARCRWGEKMGLGKKKGERKGFSAAVTVGRGDHAAGFGRGSRRRCRWRKNGGGVEGGRMGFWGEIFGGRTGNERIRPCNCFDLYYLKKKKRSKQKTDVAHAMSPS
jgi:hypothetical protein